MVYITGDIHGDISRIVDFIEHHELNSDDVVVILGDAGLNYYGNDHGDKGKKKRLNKYGVPIFCLHGNHEMRPESLSYYKESEWHGGKVYVEAGLPNLIFAKDGEIYDLEGMRLIVIGGAYSVDKYYRLERGIKWFDDEQPSEEIKRRVIEKLESIDWKIDIVLTHTCPAKYIPIEAFLPGLDQNTVDRSTEDWLDDIEDKLKYQEWYCGHWHINKRIDKMHFLMERVETIADEEAFHRKINE